MPVYTDQLNRQVEIATAPRRIVSLVPSQSELLWDLGLRSEIAGITKFCIHPDEMFRTKTRVGGTKDVDAGRIGQLHPDLIIANKEENDQEQVEALMKKYPVWVSDIKTLEDALRMIRSIGEITGTADAAAHLSGNIEDAFARFTGRKGSPGTPSRPLRTAYIIWKNPYMAAGASTFINHLLHCCALHNVFGTAAGRYPETTLEEIARLDPDVILLSSEPYPFKEKHLAEFQTACPRARVLLADGEFFSWYGSRLLGAPAYFRKLLAQV
jgi:ABC-type Fe3+-hydroxamate transport system substrate-binding protein